MIQPSQKPFKGLPTEDQGRLRSSPNMVHVKSYLVVLMRKMCPFSSTTTRT
jgi:hypothetical protein